MISPFSSIIPDCLAAPIKVPIESNILTKEKLSTSITTVKIVLTRFSPANKPAKSILNNDTSAKSLNFAPKFMSKEDNFVTPKGIPAAVATKIPMIIEPFTLRAFKTPITIRPISATSAPQINETSPSSLLHCAKSTMLTSVAEFPTTNPEFFNPIIVINKPIPGVIAIFTASGIERMIASLSPTAVITIKKIPDMNTITNA